MNMCKKTKCCPILLAAPGESRCMKDRCAWYCEFAEDCSIPILAGMFADSEICRTVFDRTPPHACDVNRSSIPTGA